MGGEERTVRAGQSDQCEPWGQHWDNSRWSKERPRSYQTAVTTVPMGVPSDAEPSRRVVGLQMTDLCPLFKAGHATSGMTSEMLVKVSGLQHLFYF